MKKFLGSPILSVILIFITFIFLFLNLERADLQFWDEATNAGVVVESAKSTDWWNLRYEGGYFWEKPPLFYWIGVIFMKILPNVGNLTVLRVITAVSAGLLVSVLILILKTRKKSPLNVNILLLTILAIPFLWLFTPTGILATHNFRSLDSDILQLLFISASILFLEFYKDKNIKDVFDRKLFLIISAVCCGLAVMTKGIFGFIPFLFVLLEGYELFKKDKRSIKKVVLDSLLFLAASFLIILPWHLYMYLNFGREFVDQYFIYHQLGRAGGSLEGHSQPVYFYLTFLFDPRSGMILIPTLVIFLISRFKFSKWLVIGLFLVLLFSIIQTKISWYILPAVPFFLLYIAENFSLKNKVISYSLFTFLVVAAFFNLSHLIHLPETFDVEEKHSTTSYISSTSTHRVFYAYELMGKIKRIEIKDFDEQNRKDVLPARIYADKNEIGDIDRKLEGTNYRISFTEAVSDNYVVAHLIKLN